MPTNEPTPGSEFQALPLEFFVATPMLAAVRSQAASNRAALDVLRGFFNANGVPRSLPITAQSTSEPGKQRKLSMPIAALMPHASLRVERLNVQFQYEVRESYDTTSKTNGEAEVGAGTNGLLKGLVSASLRGSLSHERSKESRTARSGVLKMEFTASEAPMPEGLARLLTLLSSPVPAGDK